MTDKIYTSTAGINRLVNDLWERGSAPDARRVERMFTALAAERDALRAELAKSEASAREQVAGAYLAAAHVCEGWGGHSRSERGKIIRALTPADAIAALAARDARVRAEERAKIADLVSTMSIIASCSPAIGTRIVAGAALRLWRETDDRHTDASRKAGGDA